MANIIKRLVMLLMICSVAKTISAQNLRVEQYGVTPVSPDCTGLYLPYTTTDSYTGQVDTHWVREDGQYHIFNRNQYDQWFLKLVSNQLVSWNRPVEGILGFYPPCGIYNPDPGETGLLIVTIEEGTASRLAPSILSNLVAMASNTLALTENTEFNGVGIGEHLQNISYDTGDALNSLANIESYGSQTVGKLGELKSTFTTNMSSNVNISDALRFTPASQIDTDGDGFTEQVEIAYNQCLAMYENKDVTQRSQTDFLKLMWEKLENGTISTELVNSNINVQMDLSSLEGAISTLDGNNQLRHEDMMSGYGLNLGTLETNVEPSLVESANTALETEVNNLDYEIEQLKLEHTKVIGATNFLGSVFALTIPDIGTQSVASLTVPWSYIGFMDANDKQYDIDFAEFTFMDYLRKFMHFVLFIGFLFMSFKVIRKAIA